jgi:hypothetical protein
MSSSISPLSSTGKIANEFHGADVQTINQHSVVPKASKGVECRRVWRYEIATLATVFSSNVGQMPSLFQSHLDNRSKFGSVMD